MKKSIYDVMLELPLFQGLSVEQFTGIIEKIPFSFEQYPAGEVIVRSDEDQEHVNFVLSGKVRLRTPVFQGKIGVMQDFEAPFTAPFHYLFGVQNKSAIQLEAVSDTGVMRLEKSAFLDMVQGNRIILLHVLNMLSTLAQRRRCALDFLVEKQMEVRLAAWMLSVSHHKALSMTVEAESQDLLDMLRMQSSDLWRSVAVLEGKGCVEECEGCLKLTDRYALKHFVNANSRQ